MWKQNLSRSVHANCATWTWPLCQVLSRVLTDLCLSRFLWLVPPPLDSYQSSEAKENSSCCHEDYVCGEVYELLLQLGFCHKKKKKKLNKNQIFTQIYEKNRLGMEYMQVSMWRPPKLYTLASWCLSRHFSFFFFLFFDIFLSGNIFSILARIYVSYLKNWHEGKDTRKAKGSGQP